MCYSGKCPHENQMGDCMLPYGKEDCPRENDGTSVIGNRSIFKCIEAAEDDGRIFAKETGTAARSEYEILHTALADANSRCTEWHNVAMAMMQELRDDYAPGQLGELDGVKAISRLRAEYKGMQVRIKELEDATAPILAEIKEADRLGHPPTTLPEYIINKLEWFKDVSAELHRVENQILGLQSENAKLRKLLKLGLDIVKFGWVLIPMEKIRNDACDWSDTVDEILEEK